MYPVWCDILYASHTSVCVVYSEMLLIVFIFVIISYLDPIMLSWEQDSDTYLPRTVNY